MKLTEMFIAELDREVVATRRVLEQVPDGRTEWKPHEKSMPFGYLATLVATMPSWIEMMVQQDSLDFNPPGGSTWARPTPGNAAELVATLEQSVAQAKAALAATTDEHLMTGWKLLNGGVQVSEQPRHLAIRDGVMSHWAHHRGQLTVYLRLNDARVPSVYGPSADEPR